MLRIFPYIFIVIMTAFTVVPTVDQVWGNRVCKIITVGSGMAEEEIKEVKELHIYSYDLVAMDDAGGTEPENTPFFHYETLLSQLFVLLPELPPEA